MGIGSVAGTYANFIFGTGQETVTNSVSNAIKNRGSQSYLSALYQGTKNGINDSYNVMKNNGGYLNTLKTDLGSMVNTFKTEKGFKKLGGLSKGFPLIMTLAAYWQDIAGIFKAGKNEGIGSGVKEAGRTVGSIGLSTLLSSVAAGMCKAKGKGGLWGLAASMAGYTLGSIISGKLFGKSYNERVAEAEQGQQVQPQEQQPQVQPQFAQEQPQVAPQPYVPQEPVINFPPQQVAPTSNISFHGNTQAPSFPPIESNYFGGYYGYNNPGMMFNSAAGMMSPMMGMGMGFGMQMMPMGAMGANGSVSGNLIANR